MGHAAVPAPDRLRLPPTGHHETPPPRWYGPLYSLLPVVLPPAVVAPAPASLELARSSLVFAPRSFGFPPRASVFAPRVFAGQPPRRQSLRRAPSLQTTR